MDYANQVIGMLITFWEASKCPDIGDDFLAFTYALESQTRSYQNHFFLAAEFKGPPVHLHTICIQSKTIS